MVTLNIDDQTYEALSRRASARGMTVEEWLKSQCGSTGADARKQLSLGDQMAAIFSEIGLRDDETIPELKGQPVRVPKFD